MQALHSLWRVSPRVFISTFMFLTFLLFLALPPVQAANLPAEHTPDAKTTIKYDDLDYLLKQTVLKLGRSDHKAAPKPPKITGSNVTFDNPKPSRLEGNRVLFHQNQDDIITVSAEIRDAMLDIPGKVPLERLNKNEQLAYWLNLHNIIVYHEIAKRYPITDLKGLMERCPSKKSLRCEAKYSVAGTAISLDDIERHVIQNWDNPLVIYGFYMGAVGTPNMRAEAYSGKEIYRQLEKNAVDFIHSVRGTRVWSKKNLRVSDYYTRMSDFFPDFQADLMTHIRDYAERDFLEKINRVTRVKANLNDWHIADLYNGHMSDPAGINGLSRVSQRVGTANSATPVHVTRLLEAVVKRNSERQAQVTVEEYVEVKKKPTDEQEASSEADG